MKKLFLLISLMLITGVFLQAQTVDVTFQVDMRVKIATGYFNPSTDVVTCPGDFNNWLNEPPANTEKVMTDPNNDSVYSITINMAPNTTYGYKFNIGLGWDGKDETQGNRSVVVGAANMTVDPSFFNDYNPVTEIPSSVTFSVDMQLPAQGDFEPGTDHVFIAGNFTDWQNAALEMDDPDGDSIYTLTVSDFTSGDLAIYKFVWSETTAPNGNWESPQEGDDIIAGGDNRIYGVHDGDNTVSRWWNNVNPTVQLADGNIFFEVDMSVPEELGVFDPGSDSVQIRGAFNGWNANDPDKSLMSRNALFPWRWYIDMPFIQEILNSNQLYKFFIKNDPGNPPYSNTGWEVPIGNTISTDRNRAVVFEGDPSQVAPYSFFENINPDWVIPTGTTVEIHFSLDMTNATNPDSQTVPFVPATDSVWWIPRQPLYYAINGLEWTTTQRVLQLTDPNSDMIYTGTLTINGPAFNGFLYNYAYGTTFTQEGGGQGGARVRFVGQNGGPRLFDSPWDMPLDVWSNSEKPEETGPEGWVSVKEIPGNPQTYSLEQNFPNPFNPSTKIRFSIPEQGLVTLKVFNLLGEEIATLINTEMTVGSYEADFRGTEISSGIYFYTLTADNFISTKKMILLK
jgi:Secretion system C-terminal sorting domain